VTKLILLKSDHRHRRCSAGIVHPLFFQFNRDQLVFFVVKISFFAFFLECSSPVTGVEGIFGERGFRIPAESNLSRCEYFSSCFALKEGAGTETQK